MIESPADSQVEWHTRSVPMAELGATLNALRDERWHVYSIMGPHLVPVEVKSDNVIAYIDRPGATIVAWRQMDINIGPSEGERT